MPRDSMVNIQSVERALRLLEHLSENHGGKRLVQLAQESGLPPSTVHRALQTLSVAGYVCQDSTAGLYRLTGKLLDIASRAIAGRDLRAEALPQLKTLRDLTGESSHLVVLDSDRAVTVESVLSSERNLVDCPVGERVPLHCTAVGKCLIAFLGSDGLESTLSQLELTRSTANTICTVSGLRDDLASVRELGYAVDWEENEVGIRCVAAPVRGASGDVVAAVGISGPATRITEKSRNGLADHVVSVALAISRAIGYAG